MRTRILVAVVGIPLLLIVLLALPPIVTGLFVAGMAVIAVYELMLRTGLVRDIRLVALSVFMALFVCLWCCGRREWVVFLAVMWAYFLAMFGLMLASHGKLPFESICISAFAGIVLPLLLASLTRIQMMDFGRFYILIPFVLCFGTDSAAYFVGCAFGKHKMAPIISPKKSWEGAVGGVLGGIVLMMLYVLILKLAFGYQVRFGAAVLYGVAGAVFCVLVDLVFSVIKRQTGIKDYGNLLPGHGGILDRFDSTIIVAPLVESLLLLLPLITG